jgi:hypothetical protein
MLPSSSFSFFVTENLNKKNILKQDKNLNIFNILLETIDEMIAEILMDDNLESIIHLADFIVGNNKIIIKHSILRSFIK